MIKLTAGLAIALLVSMVINLFQLVSSEKAKVAAPLKAQILTFEQTAAINNAVTKQRAVDDVALQAAIADAQRTETVTLTNYRDRVVTLPAPVCAPGVQRVAAWNIFATEVQPR